MSLSILVGLLDGFGLAMFLPLLEMVDGKAEASSEAMGNLGFLVKGLKTFGLTLDLKTVLLVMLLFFVLKGIAKFAEIYYRVIVQQYFIKKLRLENIDYLTHYNYKAFVTADAGRIQNSLSGETERVAAAYRSYFMSMQMAVMLFVYIFLAVLANPQFAILVSLGGILSNLIFKLIYKRTKELSRKITSESHNYQGLLIQKVAFFKYLKATGINHLFSEKLKKAVQIIENHNLKTGYYSAILQAIREPITIALVVVVILVQVSYFDQALGLIILSLLFFYRSLTFLMALQTSWNSFLNMSGSLENISDFQMTLKKEQQKFGKSNFEVLKKGFELKNVSFSYGNELILKNINLNLSKNQTFAFVGESGSGKTTLVNLIAGLMPPSEGKILLDGVNYSNLNLFKFQKRIGYITQEPIVFNDTIFNNVTLWSESKPENLERFWKVMEEAAITDFVMSLGNKENTLLGNNGINLSGGQKQRISIAREFFKEIDLLILDEATSSLDSETEKIIQRNIDSYKGKLTIIIIAHRLSTIKNTDQVVLFNHGKIESVSNFYELLEINDKFKEMVRLQKL
ncbi:ABC transporter ATP-binding protein [Shivajiella indica]|uniref:ABC transporter ATP-binding protein n=1 Tax=Shivajiella indica TaxID=872115 RepID=A0ABW5BE62_9BACT